jgi:deoxycytidylate deaminase
MPAGWDNDCETKEWWNPDLEDLHYDELEAAYPFVATSDEDGAYIGRYRLRTKPEVLHAERNALDKLAKGNEGGLGASMFITHAPCLECAKSIYGAGISQVFYGEDYRAEEGIYFLKKCGVKIEKLSTGDK